MTDSWWIKVKRAQKHMVDINSEARRYAASHPYKFTRVQEQNAQGQIGYRVRITEHPDPMIAVMLGDFVHNLRCALDYIIVACVPRKRQRSASFPVLFDDIWAKDENGSFVIDDTGRREKFVTAINGLSPAARTLVMELQPYNWPNLAYRIALGLISRLENADKHRQLITVGGGVQNIAGDIILRGERVPYPQPILAGEQFAKDDTVIGWEMPSNRMAPDGSIVKPSEVNIEFTGTAKILIKITRIGGNEPPSDFPLRLTLLTLIQDTRRILRLMEPFVRR